MSKKLRNLLSLLICFLAMTATPVKAASNTSGVITNTNILLILLLLSVIVNILIIKVFVAYYHTISQKEKTSARTNLENNDLKETNNRLTKNVQVLENWKKNVKKAVPNIENLIADQVAKENAEIFDKTINNVLKIKPSAETYATLKTALNEYKNLPPAEQTYVTANIESLVEKIEIAKKCYISAATRYLKKATHYIPTASEHEKWEKVINYYTDLPTEIQIQLDKSLVSEIFSMYQMAMADHTYFHLADKA